MVHTNPDRPGSPPQNPDATQGDSSNTNASHEAKPPFSRSITMGGTTPVAQEKNGQSHITGSGPIPFNLSGSPQTTPPPVVVPKTRRALPLDGETTVQQHGQENSHKAPESLASRKGLTGKNPGGLTLSTASTVVDDAPRESASVTQHPIHDVPTTPAGPSSQDALKTPTKSAGSAKHEAFQLPIRQAKIDAVIAEESEESKEEASEQPKESSKLSEEADKQPQDANTSVAATSLPTDGSAPSGPSAPSTPTIASLQAEIARLQAENASLQSTLTAAAAAETDTHARYHVLHTRALRSDRENRQSTLLADRVHRHGQRAHDRAQQLLTLYTRAYNDHRAALSSGKDWKARAEAAEKEKAGLLDRALEAEREVGELRKWRAEAQVEGEGLWDKAEGLLARVGKVEGELRVEREKAAKYRRRYEDLKIEKEEREKREKEGQTQQGQGQIGQGQGQGQTDQIQQGENQQGHNQQVGGIVADIAARVIGRVNNEFDRILEDVYGTDVAKEKMAQVGWLAQDPVIHEPLELEMDDEKDMEEREKELGGFFNYFHQRGEFVKNAGMDATEEQFNKAMKMEARAREEVRRLGRKRTKSF
ncbi:uncharacterized protein LTHEOB_140 [Lasiodiplodia theobromae]|uniref:uncharacterized protein n=1 Tax=Lasiodiplodia theobromae TaxID=45133 RepID=UPI0015C3C9E9|nr:uncharacterized protein LTHEOB_140 [Lasiodiplodia theobromae]KAF4543441.1 hypothetical protein LTHEOB_140 [Lasiodiplodia theobromae]